MKLYEITNEKRQLDSLLDDILENSPEDVDLGLQIMDRLQITEESFMSKAEAILHVKTEYDAKVKALEAEIERMTKLKKSYDRVSSGLKERLGWAMEVFGHNKLVLPTFAVTKSYTESVADIEDDVLEKEIPDTLKSVITKVSLKKSEAKQLYKERMRIADQEPEKLEDFDNRHPYLKYVQIQTKRSLRIR